MPRKRRTELKEMIKNTILNSDQPMDVYAISKKLDCTSYIIIRLFLEIFLDDLKDKSPEILETLDIRPLKTTKSFVFIPQNGRH